MFPFWSPKVFSARLIRERWPRSPQLTSISPTPTMVVLIGGSLGRAFCVPLVARRYLLAPPFKGEAKNPSGASPVIERAGAWPPPRREKCQAQKKIIFPVDINPDSVMIICMKTEKTIPNLLSTPSKMPCFSFNIPAWKYCPGAKVFMNMAKKAKEALDNVICSSCYALKGFYMMPNVADALKNKAND